MQQYSHLFLLLSILYFFLTTLNAHECNESKKDLYENSFLKLEQFIQTIYFLFIIIFISIISLYWITYYQAKQQKTSSPVSKKTASITTNINRNINELPQFKPIKPCVLSYIHRAQAEFVLDELITGAEKTKFFTIVPKFNSLYIDYMFMHIELIQDSQTIIALIEYFNETDRNSQYYHKLQQFFTITFNSSKIIQTWGNLIDQLIPYIQYGLFTCNEISQVKSINVQKEFKLWYNNIFRHHLQCHHYLKYDEIDGSLCSCIHRPYKASSCQWSISKAIAYTFDERYDYYTHDIHKCLAITKLGYVVSKKWTSKKLEIYKQKQYMYN